MLRPGGCRDGLCPFLGVFLQEKGWTPDGIGFVMAAGGAAVMLCTIPLGTLADQTRHKRRPIALSVVLMALGCGAVFLWSEGRAVGLSKTVQGQPSCRPCCGHKPGDGGAGKARCPVGAHEV